MVTEEEIQHVSKMMKIEITDHAEYIKKVHAMIDYFGILDSAGVESEEITMADVPISSLREDEYIKFNDKIIDTEDYIKAPKMS